MSSQVLFDDSSSGGGFFEYISPGLLASSIISFGSFGIILGFGGVLIQDWANEEDAFSWAKSLNGK